MDKHLHHLLGGHAHPQRTFDAAADLAVVLAHDGHGGEGADGTALGVEIRPCVDGAPEVFVNEARDFLLGHLAGFHRIQARFADVLFEAFLADLE